MLIFGIGDPVSSQYHRTNVIADYPVQHRFGMPFATFTAAKATCINPGAQEIRLGGREIADVYPQKRWAPALLRKYRRLMMSRISHVDRRQDGQRVGVAPEERFNRRTFCRRACRMAFEMSSGDVFLHRVCSAV